MKEGMTHDDLKDVAELEKRVGDMTMDMLFDTQKALIRLSEAVRHEIQRRTVSTSGYGANKG